MSPRSLRRLVAVVVILKLILVVPLAVAALGLLAEAVQSGELLEVIRVVAHLQHKVKAQLAILITHFTRARGAALERGALRFFFASPRPHPTLWHRSATGCGAR